jgi:hypothetical protein
MSASVATRPASGLDAVAPVDLVDELDVGVCTDCRLLLIELTCDAPDAHTHVSVTALVCPGCGRGDAGYACAECSALEDGPALQSAA